MKTVISAALLLALASCARSPQASHPYGTDPGFEEASSDGALIESDALWEALASGTENSPEIKYARRVGSRLATGYQAEQAAASMVAATPPASCRKLPPIDVVLDARGKVTKAVNRAKSCWVNGTRMAIKASQALQVDAPPAGLLKNGNFKFSWTPEIPDKKPEEPKAN